ncbi:PLC-like phosphodiesterase, TIM beta/alpha-barrel domain-containing protein [Cynara cardunculus var. scolymus]|uniref:PLC-like phosphodiesterase, TIM beta/alpha-barrel domain-containing protein n=1 Tax=Cynara cardunculus var. scolymus TaxID=59895 RepID=A0A124SC29_CYNCS|nr:PLC-like phosphodiesterase, TIM beta/alpha-barrel domain-containing protein [Cynara cardunculus var. scolymus]
MKKSLLGGDANQYLLLFVSATFFLTSSACSNGECQVLESCSAATDCAAGLYCGNCPQLGKTQPFCIRGQAVVPTSINGVRGLMLDMYDFENDIWLCHSFHGQCLNITAFVIIFSPVQPAINTLREVEAFLSLNPTEIVTIIIEDYVHTPRGLTKLFVDAGLDKYLFPVSKMPRKGEDWPTVTDMAQQNHRLLVFTSDSSKEGTEGIAYQWRYMVENDPGDPGVEQGSCPNRKESKPLTSKTTSLFLQNYFPTMPVQAEACKEHSAPLMDLVGTCYKAAGNVMPNFLAVNFYMRSDGGGVFDALDRMNGPSLCGCVSVTACQTGASFGACRNNAVSNSTSPRGPSGSFSGTVQLTGSASRIDLTSEDKRDFIEAWLLFFNEQVGEIEM